MAAAQHPGIQVARYNWISMEKIWEFPIGTLGKRTRTGIVNRGVGLKSREWCGNSEMTDTKLRIQQQELGKLACNYYEATMRSCLGSSSSRKSPEKRFIFKHEGKLSLDWRIQLDSMDFILW